MLLVSAATVKGVKLHGHTARYTLVQALDDPARLRTSWNAGRVLNTQATENTRHISIKGFVGFTTTVIGVNKQRLSEVAHGVPVGISHCDNAFR
ncbi:Uncharacterised protein [Klebsiella pneumoniae]|nr:Uncharacterised protein [Klebsiella pneumoniae]SYP32403.1 Uncharacterised protein [Klebsiella pneumoniae]